MSAAAGLVRVTFCLNAIMAAGIFVTKNFRKWPDLNASD